MDFSDCQTGPFAVAPVAPGYVRYVVRDLVLNARVGIYEHEHEKAQRIRVSLDLDTMQDRFDPGEASAWVREVALAGHVMLVETLVERIAVRCLADGRIDRVRVRADKLDIFPDTVVGVEIIRRKA